MKAIISQKYSELYFYICISVFYICISIISSVILCTKWKVMMQKSWHKDANLRREKYSFCIVLRETEAAFYHDDDLSWRFCSTDGCQFPHVSTTLGSSGCACVPRRNSQNACKINRDVRNSLLLATANMCCPFRHTTWVVRDQWNARLTLKSWSCIL